MLKIDSVFNLAKSHLIIQLQLRTVLSNTDCLIHTVSIVIMILVIYIAKNNNLQGKFLINLMTYLDDRINFTILAMYLQQNQLIDLCVQ